MLTLIRCPFYPRVTAVARKKPGHSAKRTGGRFYLKTYTPLTQRSRSGLAMPLSRHSLGTFRKRAHTQLVWEQSAPVVSARPLGLTFKWWECYDLRQKHKPAELAPSFLFCSCVYFCPYDPFYCISFHKFSRRLSVF